MDVEYEYDQGGNILSKRKYALGVTTGTASESKTFTYGNANWKDQLTAVNGTPITYDAIGNPLSDGTWTYTWEKGRQLADMSKSGTTANFKYNENGLRIQKTVNGVVTDYTLHGKNIVHMTQGSNNLHFFYDASNKPAIVEFNGTKYAYVHNLQGDIVAILDSNGNKVVEYKYDAWGKPFEPTGSMKDDLGKLNPFRYRGYVYDEETGLYYLRSRYYQPIYCRFVNEDTNEYIGSGYNLCENNLYTYCRNTPIQKIDPNGELSWDWGILTDTAITAVSISIELNPFSPPLSMGVFNNLVNAIYYGISERESSLNGGSYHDQYISRWDRLDYAKQQSGDEHYSVNAWRYHSEYSVHMYGWFVLRGQQGKGTKLGEYADSLEYAEVDPVLWDDRAIVMIGTFCVGILGW